ncbi:MAG: response regulator transcription factor [Verrucomicrobiota bacterium]
MKSEINRVFIVDDHPFFRAGLRQSIEMEPDMEICGESGEGINAAQKIIEAETDVVLLDLTLGDYHGLSVIRDLRAATFRGGILVISMHDENIYVERVLDAGAQGYVAKDEATDLVVEGIRKVAEGHVFLSDRARTRLLSRFRKPTGDQEVSHRAAVASLSDRQLEVFELMGRGLSTSGIASRLHIGEKTVETHYRQIKSKLQAETMRELVCHAANWVGTQGKLGNA